MGCAKCSARLSKELLAVEDGYRESSDARLSYSIAYKLIRRLTKHAGIASASKITPHSLRHSFATELLARTSSAPSESELRSRADDRELCGASSVCSAASTARRGGRPAGPPGP